MDSRGREDLNWKMEEFEVEDIAVVGSNNHVVDRCIDSHLTHDEQNSDLGLSKKYSHTESCSDTESSLISNSDQTTAAVVEIVPVNEPETSCGENKPILLAVHETESSSGEEIVNKPFLLAGQTVIQVITDDGGYADTLGSQSDVQLVVDMEGNHLVVCKNDAGNELPTSDNVSLVEMNSPNTKEPEKESHGANSNEGGEDVEMSVPQQVHESAGITKSGPSKEKPFLCDLCSATFTRLGNFTRHRMIHTIHMKDDYRYKCDVCERMFLQRCDLKRHTLVHQGSHPYKCETCGKGYIRKSDLVVHRRFHNNERSFPCPQCTKAFFQSGDLLRHQRLVHRKEALLTCGHCQRKYSKEATLIRHMQTAHRDLLLSSLVDKGSLINSIPSKENEQEVA